MLLLAQVLDKHVKSPLSSAKSTRNVRLALEDNGKYAVKTGKPNSMFCACVHFLLVCAAVQTALFRLAATFAKERRYMYGQ